VTQGGSELGRCLAVRPQLKAWRCSNEAGSHWFCYQHQRWSFLCLIGLFVAVFLPMGISYTWGLFAPPTKVEGEQTALLQNIRKLLENSTARELNKFFESRGFEPEISTYICSFIRMVVRSSITGNRTPVVSASILLP
jgi:hypothetical protein